jgi:uncharacterized membrane protein
VSVLIATGFKDPYRAAEVLNELQRRRFKWVVDLDRAVVVRNEERNEFKVQFCLDLNTEEESAWVRLWGSFLSLTLFVPSTEKIVEAAKDFSAATGVRANPKIEPRKISPDVKWWRESLCLSNDFVRDVGAMIQPGDSALFMLLHANDLGKVLRELRNYGGTPLHTTLSPEQDRTLKDVLAPTQIGD